jgi:hypothetical protein
MITQQKVLELFEYRGGGLYWRVKPAKQIAIGAKAGCKNSHGYSVVRVNGVLYGTHRIIFLMHHGYLPDYIDHVDGNRLNNSIENLRAATACENGYNKPAQSNNKSGCKGVRWQKQIKHWCVEIQANKVKRYLGIYKDLELAALVAAEARDLYHGKFARQGA